MMRQVLTTGMAGTLALAALPAHGQTQAPPTPAPDLAPSLARGAVPKELNQWAGQVARAYPAEALRQGLEGRVGVRVGVDPTGLVSSCMVIRSSGHQILDQAACTSMTRFAKFHPARDAQGNPARGSYQTTVSYLLGSPEPPPSQSPDRATDAPPV